MGVGAGAAAVAANTYVIGGTAFVFVIHAFAGFALYCKAVNRLFNGGNQLFDNIVLLSKAVAFGFTALHGIGIAYLYAVKTA